MLRHCRKSTIALAAGLFLTLFWLSPLNPRRELVGGLLVTTPPTYAEIIEQERSLPQHNVSLPFPEGENGRYVKFSNQVVSLGWNNVLNDV